MLFTLNTLYILTTQKNGWSLSRQNVFLCDDRRSLYKRRSVSAQPISTQLISPADLSASDPVQTRPGNRHNRHGTLVPERIGTWVASAAHVSLCFPSLQSVAPPPSARLLYFQRTKTSSKSLPSFLPQICCQPPSAHRLSAKGPKFKTSSFFARSKPVGCLRLFTKYSPLSTHKFIPSSG